MIVKFCSYVIIIYFFAAVSHIAFEFVKDEVLECRWGVKGIGGYVYILVHRFLVGFIVDYVVINMYEKIEVGY